MSHPFHDQIIHFVFMGWEKRKGFFEVYEMIYHRLQKCEKIGCLTEQEKGRLLEDIKEIINSIYKYFCYKSKFVLRKYFSKFVTGVLLSWDK